MQQEIRCKCSLPHLQGPQLKDLCLRLSRANAACVCRSKGSWASHVSLQESTSATSVPRGAHRTQIEFDCGATLIVSPVAILEQWKTEIAKHTHQGVPSLHMKLTAPSLQL